MVTVYINDDFMDEAEANISVRDRGLTLGDGIFETLKASHGALCLFQQHFSRLKKSADYFLLSLPYSEEQLRQPCIELLKRNNLASEAAVVRITLTRGVCDRGIDINESAQSTLLITAGPYQPSSTALRVMISDIRRSSFSLTSHHKTLNYLENIMARKKAKALGFDDALFLNEKGDVVCTTAANVFFIKGQAIYTPSLACGALPGIMRAEVIGDYHKKNKVVHEVAICVSDLNDYDGCFVTNSLVGSVPVVLMGEISYGVGHAPLF